MKGSKKSPSSSTYLRGNSYSNRELPKRSGGQQKPAEEFYGEEKDEDNDQRLNNARIRALENMKNHEGVYIEYLENLSGKKEAREEELRREKDKIDDLIEKNSKVVLKLVGSYFEELKEQWLNNYHQVIQDKMIGGISSKIKKIRQKLSKIRKISESFVSGNYEEDLLNYGLEKDLGETQSRLDESLEEIEMVDKTHLSNVILLFKRCRFL
jgi:hypothetical protein